MSTTIDNRIVEMQFNNSQFEQGVSQSLSTLDKLKAALKLDNAAKGFDDISSSANKMDLSGLTATLTSVSSHFSTLEIVAITAIQNIANRLTNMGIAFAKSLSINQVTAGWGKFSEKAQSVNTIMAATGESVETVGEQLDKLNTYTDETSASFTDMTSNIGKFTNAGVKLEDATKAMQGITNWAYLSGASVNEAGRAMYNLSQAMAVGSVKLIDWKSIENANMATTKFKQTAIDTAVAMGQLKDKGDGVYKTLQGNTVTVTNFNEALKDQWFSSDVLTATLSKFGSFSTDIIELSQKTGISVVELMDHFKDFENNNIDYSAIAAEANMSADEIREAFLTMGTASDTIAQRLLDGNSKLKKILDDRSTWFRESAGEDISSVQLLTNYLNTAFTESEGDAERFKEELSDLGIKGSELEKIFEEMASNQTLGIAAFRAAQEYRSLKDAVDATMDTVSTGWMKTFELIFGNAEEAKQVWSSVGETLYEVFASGAKERNQLFANWHNDGGYESFVRTIENLSSAIIGFKELVDEVFSDSFLHIGSEDSDALVSLTQKLEAFSVVLKGITTGDIEDVLPAMNKSLQDLSNVDLSELGVDTKEFGDQIARVNNTVHGAEVLQNVIEGLANAFDILKRIAQGVSEMLSPLFGMFKTIGGDVVNLIDAIARRLTAFNASDMEKGGIIGFFVNLKNKIVPIVEWLSGVIHTFIQTITNIIDPDVQAGLSDFSESFQEFFSGIGKVCQKIFPVLSSIGHTIGDAITTISTKIKEFIDSKSVGEFFSLLKGGIGVGIWAGIAKLIGTINSTAGNLKGGGIMGLIFGTNTSGGGSKGFMSTLKSLPDEISNFAKRIGDSFKKFVDVEAFKAFGAALLMIAGALFIISAIPTDSLSESLATLSLAIAGIVAVMELFGKSSIAETGKMVAAGAAFVELSAAILVLSAALLVLALIPADRIQNALGALAGMLTEVGLALAAMQLMNPGKLLASATAMLILAPALLIMAVALAALALIPSEKIASGLQALFGVLVEAVGALALLSAVGPMCLVAAAALLILSPALVVFAAALLLLSAIPAEKIMSTLATLAIALLTLVGSLSLLSLVGPMSLVAAAALLVLSPALLLFAAALVVLSMIPMESLGTALIGLGASLMIVVAAAWAVAPVVAPLLAFAAAMLVIAASLVVLGAGLVVIAAGITALVGASTLLVTVVVSAIEAVITAALQLLTDLFQFGADLMQAIIDGIESLISDLPGVAQDIINGLVAGLTGFAGQIFQAAANIGRGILSSIKGALGIASPSKEMISLMGYVGEGLEIGADKVISKAEQIGDAIGLALTEGAEDGMSSFEDFYDNMSVHPVVDISDPKFAPTSFGNMAVPTTLSNLSGLSAGIDAKHGVINNTPVFNIYQQPGQDPETLARIINRELGRMYVR